MKRAIICLAICWSIIGCTLVNLPEPKVSADGKSVTYEYMHISKTVEIEYGLMAREENLLGMTLKMSNLK